MENFLSLIAQGMIRTFFFFLFKREEKRKMHTFARALHESLFRGR